MRRTLATLILLVLSTPVLAYTGGPDSIYVPGKGYVERAFVQKVKRVAKVKKAKRVVVAKKKAKTVIAGKTFERNPKTVSYHSSAAPWLTAAKRDVGKSARQLGVPARLWCADATNKWLREAGYRGTGSRAAKSFLRYGKPTAARPGAIAVYHRRGGGHVALVESVNGSKVTLVSPNCGRRGVCRYTRPVSAAISYRWPEA